jgi:hypothetical protein
MDCPAFPGLTCPKPANCETNCARTGTARNTDSAAATSMLYAVKNMANQGASSAQILDFIESHEKVGGAFTAPERTEQEVVQCLRTPSN